MQRNRGVYIEMNVMRSLHDRRVPPFVHDEGDMDTIDRLAAKLMAKRAAFIQQIQGLSAEQLSFQPAPDNWSIVMVLEHLVMAEQEILERAEQVPEGVPQNRTFRDRIAFFITILVLRCGIPVSVVSDTMAPTGRASLDKLLSHWKENQQKLLQMTDTLYRDKYNKYRFRHPFAGPLSHRQVVRLAYEHLLSHLRQVQRNLAAMGMTVQC